MLQRVAPTVCLRGRARAEPPIPVCGHRYLPTGHGTYGHLGKGDYDGMASLYGFR
jgi:hypothetical protein